MGTEDDGEAHPGSALELSAPEQTILKALRTAEKDSIEEPEIVARTRLSPDTVRGSLQRLRSKHLAQLEEENLATRRLTARGSAVFASGLPERRFLAILLQRGGAVTPAELTSSGLSDEERSAAIGILRRRRYLEDGMPFRLREGAPEVGSELPEEILLRQVWNGEEEIDPAIFQALERRGLVEIDRRSIRHWSASEEGRRLVLPEGDRPMVGALTGAMLLGDAWTGVTFRPYDVRATVPYRTGARPHPYLAWVEEFEEILVGLGFAQAEGPFLETEFWNADVLFMPQEHPARSIHDMLSVEGVSAGAPPPPDLLSRVAAVHEGRPLPGETEGFTQGWRAPYDIARARRPVLRSQTTAVSARFLAQHPAPPFRMFSIDRNFRRESVDATHHIEFGQCEGILGEDGVNLRHLIGIFHALAEAIGIRELKIRPSYFPFTEPSIEGYVRHPRLGWIEVFPGGMFRPEVLRPLGVEVPVAAWGIGITRLAMIALGANDIRELFDDDLGRLRGEAP